MQEITIELSLPVIPSVTTIQSVTINNSVYTPPSPLVIEQGNIAAITAWLNSLGLGDFTVDYFEPGSGTAILEIFSECSPLITSATATINLTENSNQYIIPFEGFECAYGDCAPLVIKVDSSIDCNDLSCINFKDVTGVYDAITNPGGYGGSNVPSYAEITGTLFGLYDSTNTLIAEYNTGYTPKAADLTKPPICIKITGFGISALTPGHLYYLNYKVNYNTGGSGQVADCVKIPFIAPCCGGSISSNLTTSFSIDQQLGCSSLVFNDTTGAYNATTNPGGYGSPNFNYSDILYTKITVVLSDGSTVVFTNFKPTADVPYFTINGIDLGYSGQIADQAINVTYEVFIQGGCRIGYNNSPILLYCQSAACLAAQRDSVLDSCGPCNGNPALDRVIALQFEFDNILNAFGRNAGCTNGLIESFLKSCLKGCTGC